MKGSIKNSLGGILLLALVITSFGAGVVVGHANRATASDNTLGLQEPAADASAADSAAPGGRATFDTFWQVWDIVHQHFVDREILDTTNLEYAAIRGVIDALGDDGHTRFLTPQELVQERTDLSGKFSGIGAFVGVRDGMPVIVAPFEGSPAAEAGIKAGDIIIEVDGEDVTSWPLSDVVDKIRGEEGTNVVLTILRPDGNESLEITVTRGEINVPAVTWAILPGTQVALIRLSQFSANANEELVKAIDEVEAAGATSFILDLRNNPGGLLEQAIQVTSQFLKDGNVLQQEDAEGNRTVFPVREGGIATEIPIVVLVNRGSASSSEIFAGAIQDHQRGPIVGETTFGTGTVLESFELDDGSGLLLGTSQWLTANGRLIRKQGIEPDVAVELPATAELLYPASARELTVDELLKSEDAQVLKALELLDALPEN